MGASLRQAFALVPDPRSRHGRRHPLPAILTWVTVAMLANAQSLAAIVEWGHTQAPAVVQALGFTRDRTPSIGTLHTLLARLDAGAVERALSAWQQVWGSRRGQAIALDGKALRGSHAGTPPEGGWIDVVAAFAHETGHVLVHVGGAGQRS